MIVKNLKTEIGLNLKNIPGKKIKRKLVAFSVDDYGSVRLASKKAKNNLEKAGIPLNNRFDNLDTLETDKDLLALYDVLVKYKDFKGNYACFTPISLSANINFDKILAENLSEYVYEPLNITFEKSESNKQTFKLIKQGIQEKIFIPQYHGREHLNVKVFEEKLRSKEKSILKNLENRSYAAIGKTKFPNIKYPSAFSFEEMSENKNLIEIAIDGLQLFEEIYGYKASFFNAPTGNESSIIHKDLANAGIKYIDKKRFNKEHLGKGKYRKRFFYSGKKNEFGQTFIVKNCVFEPNDCRSFDWVTNALKQINYAFRWNKPAIISSHRVNFCGKIEEGNRKESLAQLDRLLNEIIKLWPDVEFVSVPDICEELS